MRSAVVGFLILLASAAPASAVPFGEAVVPSLAGAPGRHLPAGDRRAGRAGAARPADPARFRRGPAARDGGDGLGAAGRARRLPGRGGGGRRRRGRRAACSVADPAEARCDARRRARPRRRLLGSRHRGRGPERQRRPRRRDQRARRRRGGVDAGALRRLATGPDGAHPGRRRPADGGRSLRRHRLLTPWRAAGRSRQGQRRRRDRSRRPRHDRVGAWRAAEPRPSAVEATAAGPGAGSRPSGARAARRAGRRTRAGRRADGAALLAFTGDELTWAFDRAPARRVRRGRDLLARARPARRARGRRAERRRRSRAWRRESTGGRGRHRAAAARSRSRGR